jgi:hypothetical protein
LKWNHGISTELIRTTAGWLAHEAKRRLRYG